MFIVNLIMAKIKISLPESFGFSTDIPVRISDVNYGGHVGNDAILSIIHEARLQYLKHHSYSELDLGGVSLIMADVGIEFKKEAFYGETIVASVAANDFQRVSFDLVYKLEKRVDEKRVIIAIAKTGMVCFDYQNRRVCAIPEEVVEKLTAQV